MSLDLEHNAWPSDSAATVISIDAEVIISRTGSNITDVRTISRSRGGIVCEVVVKWADKEWERYRVNVGRSGTVR